MYVYMYTYIHPYIYTYSTYIHRPVNMHVSIAMPHNTHGGNIHTRRARSHKSFTTQVFFEKCFAYKQPTWIWQHIDQSCITRKSGESSGRTARRLLVVVGVGWRPAQLWAPVGAEPSNEAGSCIHPMVMMHHAMFVCEAPLLKDFGYPCAWCIMHQTFNPACN